MPGRTENSVKNEYNSIKRKRGNRPTKAQTSSSVTAPALGESSADGHSSEKTLNRDEISAKRPREGEEATQTPESGASGRLLSKTSSAPEEPAGKRPRKCTPAWSKEEDRRVVEFYNQGASWAQTAQKMNGRTSKQIRERYVRNTAARV